MAYDNRSIIYFLLVAFLFLMQATDTVSSQDSRGFRVKLTNSLGEEDNYPLYKGSYALLIGVSKYNAGWPVLDSIPSEIALVEAHLQRSGFTTTKVIDPDADQLETAFEDFINAYGLDRDNRLLFFYSGHGYTRKNGTKGYLVPIDAPDPDRDLTGFLKKALGMNQLLSWARDIEAKHALFLFDSCFAGTIFKQKSRATPPQHITRLTIEPVRQFITAGSAGEEVPAHSTFTPAFIDALRYGLGDLNKDGYVSATELGLYLQAEIPAHANQNPQYGKIRDYELSRGDFIFLTDETLENERRSSANQSADTPEDPPAMLKITSTPSGAKVFIDNTFQGTTPINLSNIPSGSHTLRLEKDNYRIEQKTLHIADGKHITVDYPLIQLVSKGNLTISTQPSDAQIHFVDFNQPYSHGMQIIPGNYSLVIRRQDYLTEKVEIQVNAGEDLHLSVSLKHSALSTGDTINAEQTIQKRSDFTENIGPAPPISIAAETKKIVHSQEITLPKELSSYGRKLQSSSSRTKRDAAKTIYRKNIRHPALMNIVEQELLSGYTQKQGDRTHVDAMAWMCNILGSTGNRKYKQTLNTVANSNASRKLKKYALKNMRHIP